MPHYQTSIQHANSLLQGGWKMEVGASAGNLVASGTNIGIGNMVSFTENITQFTTQAGNATDPLQGVAQHTVTIEFECLEFWPPVFDEIRGENLDTENEATAGTYVAGTANIISTGGLTEITNKAFRFTNSKLVSAATVETVIIVYKAYAQTGLSFSGKSDNDEDPVMVIPFTIIGKLDTARTAGDQLFIIEAEGGA